MSEPGKTITPYLLGRCEQQVKGHVTANRRAGNDRARLIDALTQVLPFIGYPRSLNGLRPIDTITPAHGKEAS